MKKILFLIAFVTVAVFAQAHAWGVVVDDKGETLVGANVYWANTSVGTVTDVDGKFSLEPVESTKLLVTSYTGYHNDTTLAIDHRELTIVLVSDLVLDEVTITQRKMSMIHSRTAAFNTHTLTGDELCKAACCNLSESFETNASVDVAYADAATGAKQIRLLGLSGTYVQLLSENTPGIRGLASNYGMQYIPGPWMESIQVSKGTSSVINGYEATTGQINVEYLKPKSAPIASFNVMTSSELHAEANFAGGWDVVKHEEHEGEHHDCEDLSVSTAVLAHYQQGFMEMDENGDGFLDMPVGQHGNLLNRWDIQKGDYTGRILVRGLYDQKHGGAVRGGRAMHPIAIPNYGGEPDLYNIDLRTYRVEGYMKNGYVFDADKGTSIGIIAAASYHNQSNQYGHKDWQAAQTNAYLNAMFQTHFTDEHKLTAGLSVNFNKYDETLALESGVKNQESGLLDFDREETTPGVFAEYAYTYEETLSLLLGLRGDYSTKYGFFATPRMNVRYSPWEWWNIRASVGLGYRSANILSDNVFVMPSSRVLQWRDADGTVSALSGQEIYHQERALNAGVSTTFYIPLGEKELQLSGEYYYTHFFDGIIADMDADAHAVIFSNLNDGRSYAQNWQVEATMEILRGWTMTAAFRQTDVRQTTAGELRIKPLTNRFKGVITTSYQTPLKKWQFDVTAQFNGGGRMPIPDAVNPLWNDTFSWYPQLMAQITKYWRTCSLYIGAENMTNYKQDNPIIAADQPFSRDFDASMTYGPTTGWKVYAGFRWALEKE